PSASAAAASRTPWRPHRPAPRPPVCRSPCGAGRPPPSPASAREFLRRTVREEDRALLTLPLRGRVACRRQAGWGDSDEVMDGLKHSVGPAHHIVIPKSYDSIAFRLQPARPDVVAAKPLIISVLRSIDLDYEPLYQTGE